jgi:hypothetical protein
VRCVGTGRGRSKVASERDEELKLVYFKVLSRYVFRKCEKPHSGLLRAVNGSGLFLRFYPESFEEMEKKTRSEL